MLKRNNETTHVCQNSHTILLYCKIEKYNRSVISTNLVTLCLGNWKGINTTKYLLAKETTENKCICKSSQQLVNNDLKLKI